MRWCGGKMYRPSDKWNVDMLTEVDEVKLIGACKPVWLGYRHMSRREAGRAVCEPEGAQWKYEHPQTDIFQNGQTILEKAAPEPSWEIKDKEVNQQQLPKRNMSVCPVDWVDH